MTLFEILLLTFIGVSVISGLYFAISGRILAKKNRDEDIRFQRESSDLKVQIDMFTTRIGQMATERHNLEKTMIEWKDCALAYKAKYEELQASLNEQEPKNKE